MQPVTINERVEKAKSDEEELNLLIEEYKPFIAACTEKVTGRYVKYGEDDELSIALVAFMEAVRAYDSLKGSFLSFAREIIRRRLIDYYRKEKKYGNEVSLNEYDTDGEELQDLSDRESIERYSDEEISEYRRMELEELKEVFMQWGITFSDLVAASPKHSKTRKICKDIVNFLLSRPDLVHQIMEKKYVPVAEIGKALRIPRKNIERARKYIIAAVIIRTGDYPYIKDYVSWGVKD